MRSAQLTEMAESLLLCPKCGRGLIDIGARQNEVVRCSGCSASYPRTDGVIDLLPDGSPPPTLAQRTMEWEAIVRIYESRWWRRSPFMASLFGISFEAEQELILRAARLSGTDAVLDLACGPGIYARPLARQSPKGTVFGLDLSLPMLRYASRRVRAEGINNLVLIHGTALELPFTTGSLDWVNCCGALHLFPDVPRVLGEIHRVLRPGGGFSVAAARRSSSIAAARAAVVHRRLTGINSFTSDELASQLARAGFAAVECHHAKRIWLIMSARKDAATPRSGEA